MTNDRNEHLAGKIAGEIKETEHNYTPEPVSLRKEDDRNQHFADKTAGLIDEKGNPIDQPTSSQADEERKVMLAGIEVQNSEEDLTHLGGKEEVSAEEVAEQQTIAEELGEPVGNEIGNLTKEEKAVSDPKGEMGEVGTPPKEEEPKNKNKKK